MDLVFMVDVTQTALLMTLALAVIWTLHLLRREAVAALDVLNGVMERQKTLTARLDAIDALTECDHRDRLVQLVLRTLREREACGPNYTASVEPQIKAGTQ